MIEWFGYGALFIIGIFFAIMMLGLVLCIPAIAMSGGNTMLSLMFRYPRMTLIIGALVLAFALTCLADTNAAIQSTRM